MVIVAMASMSARKCAAQDVLVSKNLDIENVETGGGVFFYYWYSDFSGPLLQIVGDDFSLEEDSIIESVSFYGFFQLATEVPVNFDFIVFADDGDGTPSEEVLYSETVTVGESEDAFVTAAPIGDPVFKYTADIPDVELPAGNYWLMIRDHDTPDNWFWACGFTETDDRLWTRLTDDDPWVATLEPDRDAMAFTLIGTSLGSGSGDFVPPASFTNFRGVVLGAQLADFGTSDNIRATYNPGFVINDTEAPVWLIFNANAPTAVEILLESNAGTPGLSHTVEAWNFNTSVYDELAVTSEGFNTDAVLTFPIVVADHIDTNGDVQSRIGWRQTGFAINFPWEVRVDQAGWNQN